MKLQTEEFYDSGSVAEATVPRPESNADGGQALEQADAAALASALQHLIDDLPEQVALLDENCRIVAVNLAWTEEMNRLGYTGLARGDDYRAVCERHAAEGYEPAICAAAALNEIVRGERTFWKLNFRGRSEWSEREYELSFHRVADARTFITVTRFEVTEIAELRRLKQDFIQSLIEGQAVERQRLGRELHDSTAQVLTALALNLGRLKRESSSKRWLATLNELQDLVAEAQREIRSVTYLSNASALNGMALSDALRALADGFERRTGIHVSFEIRGETVLMPIYAESALYRIAQEALSNVYRHARAARAGVMLCFRENLVHLIVSDDGIGISRDTINRHGSAGVGLTGMRARLVELGGRLSVRRLVPGTAIVASMPLGQS
ncbi:MAG TPA: sensor histidine kinase [Sphingomicrobium sp.]